MQIVKVELGDHSYPIYIGENILEQIGKKCAGLFNLGKCAIITDDNVGSIYAERVADSLSKVGFLPFLITVPAGESSKSLKFVEMCYNRLAQERVERRSFIIALGGGVVGDLAGFVAATYMRGIGFVQVPTSLLAQVDSSVGGKVGINLKYGKNLAGAFYQPRLVICDLATLKTLPERELKAGLSEVIKYGVIYDENLFSYLEKNIQKLLKLDLKKLLPVIERCCQIKAEVVSADEKETGLRAILNYGHTIGHAIEAITGYKKFLHGEAVAIGQVAAAYIATEVMKFNQESADRIKTLIENAGLPTSIRLSGKDREKLIQAMKLDKKVSGGEIKFVLPEKIGKVQFGKSVPIEVIQKAIEKISTT